MDKSNSTEIEYLYLGYSNVYRNGNSPVNTIPPKVRDLLGGLDNNDSIQYFRDKEGRIYLQKVEVDKSGSQ